MAASSKQDEGVSQLSFSDILLEVDGCSTELWQAYW